MRRRAVTLFALGGLAVGLWSVTQQAARAPLAVELIGARYVAADGIPVFDRESLPTLRGARLQAPVIHWIPDEGDAVAGRLDADPDRTTLWRSQWSDVRPGSGRIELSSRDGARTWAARWASSPRDEPGIAEFIAHREARRYEEATALLETLDRSRFAVDLWIGVEHARLVAERGRPDQTMSAWETAAGDAERLGIETEVGRRYRAAAFVAWRHRRAGEMTRLLERAEAANDPRRDPAGHARQHYMKGLLAQLLGDWRSASSHLRRAMRLFDELADRRALGVAAEMLSVTLSDLGDARQALETLEEARGHLVDAGSASQARLAMNLGWLTLRALPARPTAAQESNLRARLDEGRRATAALGDRLDTANAAVNQAWGALKLGDLDIAETRLEEARLLDPDDEGYAAPYATLLQARIDLARARLDAAEAGFRRLEARARAEQGAVSELRWRALFGLGRVARARGDLDTARGHFDRALTVVDALGRRAGLRGDRATFHADRAELVDEAIELTAEREPWRAFGYADAARARPMRALQADVRVGALDPETRRRWAEALDSARDAADTARAAHARLAVAPLAEEDALRREAQAADAAREAAFDAAFAILDTATPAPGGIDGQTLSGLLAADEVLFAFHDRWTFRVDRDGTVARRSAVDDPLGDWRALPDGVAHVYIVPGGHPQAFRLATAGQYPLLEQVSVSFVPYAGLLARPAAAHPDRRPLVVADPRRDLSHAAAEGRAVAGVLKEARLLGGADATRDAVLDALASAEPFHFAGHGILHPERPWDAHLRLAGNDTLSLSDVLTHPMGPSLVVLSGCETGVDAVLLDEAVVGLPEAFLAAGARAVLATDREVDDRATRRFVDRFYAADGARRPAIALQKAALQARAEGDRAWSAFRIVGARRPDVGRPR